MAICMGVDIGGTSIRRGVPSHEGVTDTARQPVQQNVGDVIAFIREGVKPGIQWVGVACAGLVENGVMIKSPNLPWLDGMSEVELSEACGVPVYLFNDMRCAVEGIIAMYPHWNDYGILNWGSGLAFWVVRDSKIQNHAEAGHVMLTLDREAPVCGCGQRGHAEAYLGAAPLEAKIREAARDVGIDLGENLWQTIEDSYRAGHLWAKQVYNNDYVRPLAAFLASMLAVHHPLRMLIRRGTFATKRFPIIEEEVRLAMRSMVMWPGWENLPIHPSPSEYDALLGAARLAARSYDNRQR